MPWLYKLIIQVYWNFYRKLYGQRVFAIFPEVDLDHARDSDIFVECRDSSSFITAWFSNVHSLATKKLLEFLYYPTKLPESLAWSWPSLGNVASNFASSLFLLLEENSLHGEESIFYLNSYENISNKYWHESIAFRQ